MEELAAQGGLFFSLAVGVVRPRWAGILRPNRRGLTSSVSTHACQTLPAFPP